MGSVTSRPGLSCRQRPSVVRSDSGLRPGRLRRELASYEAASGVGCSGKPAATSRRESRATGSTGAQVRPPTMSVHAAMTVQHQQPAPQLDEVSGRLSRRPRLASRPHRGKFVNRDRSAPEKDGLPQDVQRSAAISHRGSIARVIRRRSQSLASRHSVPAPAVLGGPVLVVVESSLGGPRRGRRAPANRWNAAAAVQHHAAKPAGACLQ